jgi:uncharacterized membrane protein
MTELYLIMPYCCITGKYCGYGSGLAEGFLLGISIITMLLSFVELIKSINDLYKYEEIDNENQEAEVEDDTEEEEEVIEEKLEEDKKED